MPKLIESPTIVQAMGSKLKVIKEYVGRENTNTDAVSIAYMESPVGWAEPGQAPEFDEYTLVWSGTLMVETKEEVIYVKKGQAIIVNRGEWVRYSTPMEEAQYISICIPAFAQETVNRDLDE